MLRRLAAYLSANEPLSLAGQIVVRAVVLAFAAFALVVNANAALYAGSIFWLVMHSAAVSAAVAIMFLFTAAPFHDPPRSVRSGGAHERR
jgi:anti-sigma-K factor RskA